MVPPHGLELRTRDTNFSEPDGYREYTESSNFRSCNYMFMNAPLKYDLKQPLIRVHTVLTIYFTSVQFIPPEGVNI